MKFVGMDHYDQTNLLMEPSESVTLLGFVETRFTPR